MPTQKPIDFDKTAQDYRTHRQGFPQTFFHRLLAEGLIAPGQKAVDVGTGTGTLARGFAACGLDVVGVDIAQNLLTEATSLAEQEGVSARVTFQKAPAERTGLPDACADLVSAGQAWHWFNGLNAGAEAWRLLKPGGRVLIAHFDWIPLPGNVVELTESLILKHNPAWAWSAGSGLYPRWLYDLGRAGFSELTTASFDTFATYSHEAWRGRIRASAGISAALDPQAVAQFDAEHAALLLAQFPQNPLSVHHRVWWVSGKKSPQA